MSVPIIKTEYDTLENVAMRFDQQADETEKMVRTLLMILEPLERNGWEGDAAQAFFREMNNEVLPATHRLKNAMTDGSDTARQIVQVMQTAEEQAAKLFQDDLGAQRAGSVGNVMGAMMGGAIPATVAQRLSPQIAGIVNALDAAGISTQDVKGLASAAGSLAKGEISGQEFLNRATSILPELSVAGVNVQDVSTVASSALQLAKGDISPSDFIDNVSDILPISQPIRDFFGDGYTVSGEFTESDQMWGGQWSGAYGDLDVSVLGYDVQAEGQLTASWENGLNASGSFEVDAHLIDATYEGSWGPIDANAEIYVGARATGEGELIIDPRNGIYSLSAEGDIGAYATAGGEISADLGEFGSASVGGSAGVGLGAKGHFDAGFEDGVLSLDFGAGLFVGLGLEFDVNLDIDIGAGIDAIKDFGQDVLDGAKDVIGTIGDGIENVGDAIGDGLEAVGGAISDGVEAVGNAIESVGNTISNGVKAVGDFFGGLF